jgi:hypothetical protein
VCQDPSVLVGVRSQAFVATCPAGTLPSWNALDYLVDAPANKSGQTDVTISVAGHPELVLFTTRSAGTPSAEASAGSVDPGPVLGALRSQADVTLDIETTTTPDGVMAATARAELTYACSLPGHSP